MGVESTKNHPQTPPVTHSSTETYDYHENDNVSFPLVTIHQKVKNDPCSTTGVDPKTALEPYTDPNNSPLELQKVKNYLKIKSKSKVRIEGTIEN